MARSRRFRSRQQSNQRHTEWLGTPPSTGVTVLGAATSVLFGFFDTRDASNFFPGPFTIVRTRGLFSAQSDLATGGDPFGAFGFTVVSGEAFDAGIASIPTPYTENDEDRWFVNQFWQQIAINTGDARIYTQNVYPFDSKAMRKVNNGDVIVAIVENASATQGSHMLMDFRLLIKLP